MPWEVIDVFVELVAISLTVAIVAQILRMYRLLGETVRRPLRYFIFGIGANALAICSEFAAEHVAPEAFFAHARDILLSLGTILLSVSVYKFSLLVLGDRT